MKPDSPDPYSLDDALDPSTKDVWQSNDQAARAAEIQASLPRPTVQMLETIIAHLKRRSSARAVLAGRPPSEPEEPNEIFQGRTPSALLLVTLAAYHSDGLFYLPKEMRETRLVEWAEATGMDVEIVREAAILGSDGLRQLIRGHLN